MASGRFPAARVLRAHFCLFMWALCCAAPAAAVQLVPDLSVPDSLTIGDHFHLSLSVVAPSGSQVVPPAEDAFGHAVIREWDTQRLESGGNDSTVFRYVLATYIPEICTIPPLHFLVVNGDMIDTIATDTMEIPVYSSIPPDAVDSTLDIKALRPPFTAGTPSRWWVWLLCGLALAGVGIWLLVSWLESRRAGPVVPPLPPPYEEAMDALRDLELRNLVRQGQVQEHVFRLSDILKRYIERRFGVNAQEFTTEEIMLWLRASAVPREVRLYAEKFFHESDPVKYAKWLPQDSALSSMTEGVRSFVYETRPRPEPAQQAPTPPDGAGSGQEDTQEDTRGA